MPRSVPALFALLCAAMVPFLSAPLFLPTTVTSAAGLPGVGLPAAGQAGAGQAAAPAVPDPDYPYLGYLRTTITGITPTVVTSSTGPSITVTGTMTNTSKGTIYDVRYVWQRTGALAGVKAIKAEIARPSRTAAVVGEQSVVLGPTAPPAAATPTAGSSTADDPAASPAQVDLAPGASAPFLATIAVGSGGLKITARGVYALTVKVSGDIGQNGNTQYERVAEIHLLGTVLSVPLPALPAAGAAPGPSTTGDRTTAGPAGGVADPVPATVLWPVVDRPHLGVGGVFLDDSLATAIAPGGRLDGVLSALTGFTTGFTPPTLVVDPQLLDEIETMAGGYRVVDRPGSAQPPLTPSSAPVGAAATAGSALVPTGRTTSTSPSAGAAATVAATSSTAARSPGGAVPNSRPTVVTTGAVTTGGGTRNGTRPAAPPASTVAGTGQSAAVAFLARLRAAARTHPVLVLPYSDPDSVAMMRAGLDDQLAGLITRGKAVAIRVLQLPAGDPDLITDTALPVGGAVNDATLTFFTAHGMDHAVLSPATVRHGGGPVGTVAIDERADKGAMVTAALTDADVLPQLTDLVAKGRSAGLATRLTTTAALLTGGSLDGTGTPLVVLPDRRWTANAAGLSVLGGLLQTLSTGSVVVARTLPAVTAGAGTPATLAYSAAAEAAELAPDYLAQVMSRTTSVTAVGGSLTRAQAAGAPNPADVLDPLRTALSSAGAAALRTDPAYGFRILRTVGMTLDGLRAGVTIVSQSPSTLAASTAPLLITVRNDLPYGVRVKVVVVDGQSVGMTTKDPALEDIPEGGSHQFRIDASVVKAGRFQVHAQIQAADGSNWGAPTTITVSSSAYGALTIVLVAVAGGALTLMVALRLIQRVRHRNDRDGDPDAAAVDGGPEPDSILAAANESTREPGRPVGPPGAGARGPVGAAGNPAGRDASVPPASPTAPPTSNEQGEPPR